MNKVKGFTLIETLLVLQITLMMLKISISYGMNYHIPKAQFLQELYVYIETSRLDAIEQRCHQLVNFDGHRIYAQSQEPYQNKALLFDENYQIEWNEEGHILNPQTIHFTYLHEPYSLIFNLGTGVFRVEKD